MGFQATRWLRTEAAAMDGREGLALDRLRLRRRNDLPFLRPGRPAFSRMAFACNWLFVKCGVNCCKELGQHVSRGRRANNGTGGGIAARVVFAGPAVLLRDGCLPCLADFIPNFIRYHDALLRLRGGRSAARRSATGEASRGRPRLRAAAARTKRRNPGRGGSFNSGEGRTRRACPPGWRCSRLAG